VFKNAQGKFDGRMFMGVMLGLGSGAGMVIKLYYTISDSVAPFWMWAVPVVIVVIGVVGWWTHRREHAGLKRHIEEHAERRERLDAKRSE
jgi:hypothetical protein